eukprot:TRINITY_DN23629_c0_g1_i1.p1 TRINITY_DN23629_c0_g1~~TRINITY_DN23629_c0_g1_i1.p1  ORF type:complete len:212 (+),score=17.82 TRINITY_DN23629_c0_g1_i1:142-777(+)
MCIRDSLYGVLFGTGLAISGMCNPGKIIGFLALNENWDPSLIFVMVSAVGINLVTFQLILKKRESPVLLGKFPSPKSEFDLPVIVGPCIFGIGWGISGLCPGPGMLNFFILPQGFIFIIALAIGQFIGAKLIVPLLTPAPAQTPTSQPLTQSQQYFWGFGAVSYTHLRAHETSLHLVCRLLLEKKKKTKHQLHTNHPQHQQSSFPHNDPLI